MRFLSFLAFLIFLSFAERILGQKYVNPEQIHIAFGTDPTRMTVTWSTQNATQSTVAMYGIGGQLTHTGTGTMTKFVDPGTLHNTQYIHRAVMTGLKPGTIYSYKVGSKEAWSGVFNLTAMKDGSDWSPRIALFGDFGLENAQSLGRLLSDEKKHMYDAIFHVGDFAYDMDSDNGSTGDKFMNLMQPLTARLPYMTCPGNHEEAYNFTHYKSKFTMPGDEDERKMYYSFNIGPAHVISFSTEYYFYIQYGFIQPIRQFEWLKADLQEANKPENRAKHPWIITMGHRPMYCSNNDGDDCTKRNGIIRKGVPFIHALGLEKLFYDNGVDLEFWAHEHSYERLWPVYDWKVYNGSYQEPYTNPKAPVHITTGSAGCKERHDPFKLTPAGWSAFRNSDYGYTRMQIINSTHLYLEQVSDDKKGAIVDKMMLIKDKHGYGSYGKK